MGKLLCFESLSSRRQEFFYRVGKTRVITQEGKIIDFPSIVLYHRESGIPVGYPGYERWLYEMNRVEGLKTETLRKKAFDLCAFLNFILWHTSCDTIADVSLKELREFFTDFKTTADGKSRDPQEWARGIMNVMRFMHSYVSYNNDILQFKVDPEDLITPVRISRKDGKSFVVVDRANHLFVKPPIKEKKKYRFLLYGHLEFLLFEARKYDPMILLAIMLQSYAGLREGEVVNCTTSNIARVYAGFGRIGNVVIDLTRHAEFAERYGGKIGFGAIKRPRQQKVYTTFIEKVVACLDEHELRLQASGYPLDDGSPLFYNRCGKPMSVSTYAARLKKLFQEHFLPDLRKICKAQGTWAEQAPYIEAYEKEYPGAHMCRHWFTMYLLEFTTLKSDEVSHWRGDDDPTSMADYVHEHSGLISEYRNSAFTIQGVLLEEIL